MPVARAVVRRLVLFAFALASLPAQQASYTTIDQRPPYTNENPPWLAARNLPRLGTTFQVDVPLSFFECCPFQTDYFLATGFGNPDVAVPALGGYLFTTADFSVLLSFSGCRGCGHTTFSFAIPNAPELLGGRFYQQVLAYARNSFWSTLTLSRGGVGVIGR